jgi:hypothetical protein
MRTESQTRSRLATAQWQVALAVQSEKTEMAVRVDSLLDPLTPDARPCGLGRSMAIIGFRLLLQVLA